MYKTLASLFIASTALYAAEADPMAAVCDRLVTALEQETEALESISSPDDVPAGLEKLRASLAALKALFAEDAEELWLYIDNTAGVKEPIIEVLEKLAIQFARMEKAEFFGNAELREALAPQVLVPEDAEQSRRSKREKLHVEEEDDD